MACRSGQCQGQAQRGSRLPQFTAAAVVNVAAFAYGAVMGWSANAIPILQSSSTPTHGGALSDEEASWIGSLLCLGGFASTPIYSHISQNWGRKLAGYLVAVPMIISWIMMVFATDVLMINAARIVVGISSGGLFIVCPQYVGEIAEDSIRGALGVLFPFSINAGILFAFIIGPQVSFVTMALIYLVVPIVFLIGLPFVPDTPVSLLYRDKEVEAVKSLVWLRGTQDIDAELSQIKMSVKSSKGSSTRVTRADLSNRATVRGVIIGVGLCVNQQLCGIFAIMTYTVAIFRESGSDMSPTTATILVGALQLASSVVAASLMDRAGRKLLLIISNVWMAICLFAIGTFSYLKANDADVAGFGWVPVVSLSAYVVAFGVGMGPVPFVMVSEIFAPKVRGIATTLSLSSVWLLAFVVAKLYSTMVAVLGIHGSYWLFAVCCLLGTLFAIYQVPETKNRSLESILQELNGERSTNEIVDEKSTEIYYPSSRV